MEDRILLKGVLHGSVPAFRKLTTEYIPLVSRTSYRILCDRSDSDYVTREVFVSLWHDPLFYMVGESLEAELIRKTCHLCRMRLLRRKLYRIFSVQPAIFVISSPVEPSVDEFIARQTWEIFCRASLNCTDRERIVYVLCELEGMSVHSVAQAGNFLEFTVTESLAQARRKVGEELDRYGRMDDYIAYVGFLRKVQDQLTDRVRLQNSIMQELFS